MTICSVCKSGEHMVVDEEKMIVCSAPRCGTVADRRWISPLQHDIASSEDRHSSRGQSRAEHPGSRGVTRFLRDGEDLITTGGKKKQYGKSKQQTKMDAVQDAKKNLVNLFRYFPIAAQQTVEQQALQLCSTAIYNFPKNKVPTLAGAALYLVTQGQGAAGVPISLEEILVATETQTDKSVWTTVRQLTMTPQIVRTGRRRVRPYSESDRQRVAAHTASIATKTDIVMTIQDYAVSLLVEMGEITGVGPEAFEAEPKYVWAALYITCCTLHDMRYIHPCEVERDKDTESFDTLSKHISDNCPSYALKYQAPSLYVRHPELSYIPRFVRDHFRLSPAVARLAMHLANTFLKLPTSALQRHTRPIVRALIFIFQAQQQVTGSLQMQDMVLILGNKCPFTVQTLRIELSAMTMHGWQMPKAVETFQKHERRRLLKRQREDDQDRQHSDRSIEVLRLLHDVIPRCVMFIRGSLKTLALVSNTTQEAALYQSYVPTVAMQVLAAPVSSAMHRAKEGWFESTGASTAGITHIAVGAVWAYYAAVAVRELKLPPVFKQWQLGNGVTDDWLRMSLKPELDKVSAHKMGPSVTARVEQQFKRKTTTRLDGPDSTAKHRKLSPVGKTPHSFMFWNLVSLRGFHG